MAVDGGLSTSALATHNAGAAMPYFQITCDGSTKSCSCDSGYCNGGGVTTYDEPAMQSLVYGRNYVGGTGNPICNPPSTVYAAGMCELFPSLTEANVKVVYTQTGLGYVGRPNGPVPTITLSLQNVPFKFYFLGGLLRYANISIAPMTTTITGEYMSSSAP